MIDNLTAAQLMPCALLLTCICARPSGRDVSIGSHGDQVTLNGACGACCSVPAPVCPLYFCVIQCIKQVETTDVLAS